MFTSQKQNGAFGFSGTSLVVFIAAISLFAGERCWHLGAYGLWFDESFSLYAARLDWRELVRFVAKDVVHPPLFYMLLKVWINIGGESLLWLKLFPALTSVASIAPLLLLAKELRLRAAETNTVLLLVGINNYLIYYAQELRMYSLLLFFTLCCLWLFFRLINGEADRGQIFVLFVMNLLLVYTHYFGWLVVSAECLYVLLWKRELLAKFAVASVSLCLCFAPWAYMVAQAIAEKKGLEQNLAWLDRPRLYEFIYYYARLHGTFEVHRTAVLSLILFGCPLLLWAWRAVRDPNQTHAVVFHGLALFAFLPPVLAFAASYLLSQSVWGERYLIIAAVPYLFLIVIAIYKLKPVRIKTALATLLIAWAALSNIYALKRDDERLNWYKLSAAMTQHEPAQNRKTKVYTLEEFIASPLRFSLESSGVNRFDIVAPNDMFGKAKFDVMDMIDSDRETHFWMAFRKTDGDSERSLQIALREKNCQSGQGFSVSARNRTVIIFPADCLR